MNSQPNQSPELNGADTSEAAMTRDDGLAEIPAQLNELLERGEWTSPAPAQAACGRRGAA